MKGAIKYFVIWLFVTVAAMAMFFVIGFIGMEIAGYHVDADTAMENPWLFAGALLTADLLLLLIFWKRRYTRNWIEYGFTYGEGFSSRKLALWAVVGAVGCLLFDVMVQEYAPIPIDPDLGKMFGKLFNNPIGILSACLIGPLVEEAIFRGGIERRLLEKNWSPWYAIVISAILFAVAHGNYAQGVTAIIMGIFLGWVYYRTRSIWPTFLIHALNNSVAVAIAYSASGMDFSDLSSDSIGIPLKYGILLIAASLLLIYCAVRGIGKMTDDRTPIPAPVPVGDPLPDEYIVHNTPVENLESSVPVGTPVENLDNGFPVETPESGFPVEGFDPGINIENPEGDLPSDFNTQDS